MALVPPSGVALSLSIRWNVDERTVHLGATTKHARTGETLAIHALPFHPASSIQEIALEAADLIATQLRLVCDPEPF